MEYGFQLFTTLLLLGLFFLSDRFLTPFVQKRAIQGQFKDATASKAVRAVRGITAFFVLLILGFVWGVDAGSVLVFAGTTVTLLGVAFFAGWSLLSNVTAYFIILLHPDFKRGTFVRIMDADNYAEGYVSELSLFNTKLITENREVIVYPNNLILSRPALINPRSRLRGLGKLPIDKPSDIG